MPLERPDSRSVKDASKPAVAAGFGLFGMAASQRFAIALLASSLLAVAAWWALG